MQFAQANRTKPKIAKEYGFPNADGQTELKKKGDRTTSVTVAQLLFLENSFQKHKILTSFKYF